MQSVASDCGNEPAALRHRLPPGQRAVAELPTAHQEPHRGSAALHREALLPLPGATGEAGPPLLSFRSLVAPVVEPDLLGDRP